MQKQPDRLTLSDTLRSVVQESGALIRVGYPVWLRTVVRKNVIAVTLGRRVYLSRKLIGEGEARLEAIVRHELVHVGQVRKIGLVRFLLSYAREYVTHRRQGLDPDSAYEAISFEVEARAAEDAAGVQIAEGVRDTKGTL